MLYGYYMWLSTFQVHIRVLQPAWRGYLWLNSVEFFSDKWGLRRPPFGLLWGGEVKLFFLQKREINVGKSTTTDHYCNVFFQGNWVSHLFKWANWFSQINHFFLFDFRQTCSAQQPPIQRKQLSCRAKITGYDRAEQIASSFTDPWVTIQVPEKTSPKEFTTHRTRAYGWRKFSMLIL